MEITSKTIDELLRGHQKFIKACEKAEEYYRNHNTIKDTGVCSYKDSKLTVENPLQLADNRVSHDWHRMLVMQKVAYLLTYPPTFDVSNDAGNETIAAVLGDDYSELAAALGTDASNSGVGWLHYWNDRDGQLCFSSIDPKQIVPVYSDRLDRKLVGVLRCYSVLDPKTGSYEQYSEYWDDEKVRFYKRQTVGKEIIYTTFAYPEIGEEMQHDFGEVPFIPFYNNSDRTSDLILYQDLIDMYDKVYSGFANDMEDVQEIIFVLRNYGGEDRTEFVKDLKMSKIIKTDSDGGVDTIRAEIPYEARGAFLERTRKQIFLSGMGVDPAPESFGNASGVALQFLYSLLELKAGLMETQFRKGFAQLVRVICRHEGLKDPKKIIQTWTRNMIRNDQETAQIAAQSQGIISDETILKNHPWVEDAQDELKKLDEQEQQNEQQYPAFKPQEEPDSNDE